MKMIGMAKKFAVLYFLLLIFLLPARDASGKASIPKIGPVKLNPHPADLAGRTVLLRWNGKMNGDKYLDYLSSLLKNRYKDIKIIKLWETNPETAIISKTSEISDQIAAKIASIKPDVVIAAQAD
jgi:hypothetical protein